jgi:hypothetical protein
MKSTWRCVIAVAAILAAAVQQASAQTAAPAVTQPVVLGTTGACNNLFPGSPCTQTSRLVQIDLQTGALIKDIGPVGFTVNGLAWDRTTKKLYATTAIGDVSFHGLITINPATGAGTPVGPTVHNFGLPGADSPIHSLTVDPILGTMQAWYDEFPPPDGVTDTFVWINKQTGVATEFTNSGINTNANGLAWQLLPTLVGPPGHQITIKVPHLWNIDSPQKHLDPVTGQVISTTQTAWEINPLPLNTVLGKPVQRVLSATDISPVAQAALGDFNPVDNLYYGLSFSPTFDPNVPPPARIVRVDPQSGNLTLMAQTVPGLHVIAFVKN